MLTDLRVWLRQQANEWLRKHPGALKPNETVLLYSTVYLRKTNYSRVSTQRITADISEQEWEQILQKPWPDYFLRFLRGLRKKGNTLPPDYERIWKEARRAGYTWPGSFFGSLNYHFKKFGLPFRLLAVEHLGSKQSTRRIYRTL